MTKSISTTTTKAAILQRLKGLRGQQRTSVCCGLLGHSRIQKTFFGYWNCARCGQQVGDSLGGAYSGKGVFLLGHNCAECRKVRKLLTWRDTLCIPRSLFRPTRHKKRSTI